MATEAEINRLEKQVTDLSDALAHLATPDDWKHLMIIIRRPGFTSIAELILASAILDSLQTHTNTLVTLKKRLTEGCEAIVAKKSE